MPVTGERCGGCTLLICPFCLEAPLTVPRASSRFICFEQKVWYLHTWVPRSVRPWQYLFSSQTVALSDSVCNVRTVLQRREHIWFTEHWWFVNFFYFIRVTVARNIIASVYFSRFSTRSNAVRPLDQATEHSKGILRTLASERGIPVFTLKQA